MDINLKIGFIGGDKRIITAVEALYKNGINVKVWGIDREHFAFNVCKDTYEEALKDVDAVILPSPPSEDEVRVNCPLFSQESGVKIHKLFELLQPKTAVLGGRISPRLKDLALKYNLKIYDYFNREELLIKNAVPTAEGAIGIAIEKHPKTLFGADIAILGFGRIGEALGERLKLLGANVTVFARKIPSVAKAQSFGMNGKRIVYTDNSNSLCELSQGYDIIYNTVPYWIITEEILKDMKKSTLIIDLASAPGGVDMLAAKKYGVNLIHALALPAKTAPESAGIIIAESIINTLEEVLE